MCHQFSNFYAQNVSILPRYNRIHTKDPVYIPKGYNGDTCTLDPDLPVYYQNWVDHVAKVSSEAFDLINWVNLQVGGISISINEWMELDVFMREAIKFSANKVFTQQKKESERMKQEMQQKMETSGPYKSSFDGIPKPSFFQQ